MSSIFAADAVGKTVAEVTMKQMAGRDAYKETVTWTMIELVFTDGTSVTFADDDRDVWDAFEYDEVDEDGQPINPDEVATD